MQVDRHSIDTASGAPAPPELSTERVKGIFSAIAGRYDLFNVVSSLGASRSWTRRLAAAVPGCGRGDVLDVAAGTGDVTFAVARVLHPHSIRCTDLVPAMLDVARKRYEAGAGEGVPVTFEVTDAQDLPYPDGSFDVVTVAYGIRNMPQRERALSEMRRVLRDGGALVCLEFSHPTGRAFGALYRLYLRHMVPFWGGLLTGRREDFEYLSRSIGAFPDQETLARMLEDAGFHDVVWTNLTGGIAAVHVAYV